MSFGADGGTTRQVTVQISADGNDGEGHNEETFKLRLSAPSGALIAKEIGIGTIFDRQQLPGGGGGGGTDVFAQRRPQLRDLHRSGDHNSALTPTFS